jgi:hypothetical protein
MLKLILGTTTSGVKIAVREITITPTVSATINYQVISHDRGIEEHEYIMSGEQYSKWGTDDTILYHIICARHHLQYKPYIEPPTFTEVIIYKDERGEMLSKTVEVPNPRYDANKANETFVPLDLPSAPATSYDDARSVHNEADIQKIQTLQEQLDAQAAKLKTITDMLIGKGLV